MSMTEGNGPLTLRLDYDQRHVIQCALLLYEARYADLFKEARDSLSVAVGRLYCQAGGCSICNPEYHDID